VFTVLGGIGVLYLIGVPWLAVLAGAKVAIGSVVFLPGDLLKAILAASIAVTVKRIYPLIRPQRVQELEY
jgi:biotin transport system substrate-specific component